MSRKRRAGYVVSPEACYWVTTILWENDLTGCSWFESGVRDLESKDHKNNFTLIQHDIPPLERGHARVIALLKAGVPRERIARKLVSPETTMGILNGLYDECD